MRKLVLRGRRDCRCRRSRRPVRPGCETETDDGDLDHQGRSRHGEQDRGRGSIGTSRSSTSVTRTSRSASSTGEDRERRGGSRGRCSRNAAPAAGRGAAAPAPTPCGRQMATAPAGGSAGGITHDSQTEGYYIVSGSGTMFTDGYIVNGRHNLSPDLNGPTCGGMAYDVVKKTVKPGDIIIIPAGVVHGWSDIPEHVEYLSFRPSPGILTTGWVHPVLKK